MPVCFVYLVCFAYLICRFDLLKMGDTDKRLRLELLERNVADRRSIAAIKGDRGADPGGESFKR